MESVAVYRTSDVKTAEQAMLNLEKKLNERIEANTENDQIFTPDFMLFTIHSRLFLIYEHLGNTNKAAIAYQKAAKHYKNVYAQKKGDFEEEKEVSDDPFTMNIEFGELTDERLERFIRGVDELGEAPVWMTGDPTHSSAVPTPAKTEDEASCLANMQQLSIAVRVYMNDNEDQYPDEIKDMELELEALQLMCPLAPNYADRDSFTWENLTLADVSYNYLGKGLMDVAGPDTVIWRCQHHGHAVRVDGETVSDPNR